MINQPMKQRTLMVNIAVLRPNLSAMGPEKMHPKGVASDAMLAAEHQKLAHLNWTTFCHLPNHDASSLFKAYGFVESVRNGSDTAEKPRLMLGAMLEKFVNRPKST
jgi:hypothetical protein